MFESDGTTKASWWTPWKLGSKMDLMLRGLTLVMARLTAIEKAIKMTNDEYKAISDAVTGLTAQVGTTASTIDAALNQLVALPANDPRAQELAEQVQTATSTMKAESDKLSSTLSSLQPPAAQPAAGA